MSNFTGGNSPVGICADGTFAIANFSAYDYHGQSGYATYDGNVKYTYPLDFSEDGIDMGSSYIDLGGGVTLERDYKAFAVAWMKTDAPPYIPPETGVLGATDYAAVVEKDLVQVTTLPVTVEEGSDTGVVVLDAALAAELFAAPADIGILVPLITGVSSVRFELAAPAFTDTPAASRLILDTPDGAVSLPGAMLKALAGDADKTIEITVGKGDI